MHVTLAFSLSLTGFKFYLRVLERCDHKELICASTYRLVDLEDMWWGVEVSVELVDDYVETADLLSHGVGYLDETQPELSVSYSTSAQEQAGLLHPTAHRCIK